MKKINFIIIFILLFNVNAFSQIKDTLNFKVDNNELVWQKIFENKSDNLQNQFKKNIISNITINNLQEIENTISFEVNNETVDFRKYGGTLWNTFTLLKLPISYLVIIDFKDNKYRVLVKSIIADYNSFDLGFAKFTDAVLGNDGIKDKPIILRGLSYLDKHFSEKFTISVKKDDW